MDIPKKLIQIVEKFEIIDSNSLKESKLKSDYIEPFFQILGWNLKSGKTEFILEPEIRKLNKINEFYPDYLFKTSYENQFYLKIAKTENDEIENSSIFKTLHRNCWTSNIPIGVISDFHSISIYDLHSKPGSKVKLILTCNYQDYVNKW